MDAEYRDADNIDLCKSLGPPPKGAIFLPRDISMEMISTYRAYVGGKRPDAITAIFETPESAISRMTHCR